jgi:hypothetical protein
VGTPKKFLVFSLEKEKPIFNGGGFPNKASVPEASFL